MYCHRRSNNRLEMRDLSYMPMFELICNSRTEEAKHSDDSDQEVEDFDFGLKLFKQRAETDDLIVERERNLTIDLLIMKKMEAISNRREEVILSRKDLPIAGEQSLYFSHPVNSAYPEEKLGKTLLSSIWIGLSSSQRAKSMCIMS